MISAIEAQRAILADRSQPREARRDALKFLVHLVGDVHQPLHAGDRPDAGVPPTGRVTADDLRAVRFPVVLRGYRQADVDALLERLAAQQEGIDLYRPPAVAPDAPDGPDGDAADREAH